MTKIKNKPLSPPAPVTPEKTVKRRSLTDIEADLRLLEQELIESEGEIDGEQGDALEAWFDSLGSEREVKIDGYCALIREVEARSAIRYEEAKRIQQLAQADKNLGERLRNRLKYHFEQTGTLKMETRRARLRYQKAGGLAPLIINPHVDVRSVPDEFWKVDFNTTAIREYLKEHGEGLDFARLGERGFVLVIQ
jgi:hypothetical protein